jgi:hypothetical protein
MLSEKSEFEYEARVVTSGWSVRRLKLKPLLDLHPQLRDQLLLNTLDNYYKCIKMPTIEYKKDFLQNAFCSN